MQYKPQLDGLRAILFLMVFTFHHLVWVWQLSFALPCFFVLSGFLITRVLHRGEPLGPAALLKTFFARRVLRIFPAYYVVVTIAVVLGIIPWNRGDYAYVFNMVLFARSWAGHLAFGEGWERDGVHLWSMGVEEQFYIIWPLVFLACRGKWRSIVLVAGIAASIAYRFWWRAHWPNVIFGALLPSVMEYFCWGCLVAVLSRDGLLRRELAPRALWLSVVGILAVFIFVDGDGPVGLFQFLPQHKQSFLAPLFAMLVWGLWEADAHPVSRFMRARPLVYWGKMSYELYLVHLFMWLPARWIIDHAGGANLGYIGRLPYLMALTFPMSLIAAWVLWHVVEPPMLKLKARFSTDAAAAAPVPAPSLAP